MPADDCNVSVSSDVPLLRVGLERAVGLAGLSLVKGPECSDITVRAGGQPGAEQVTLTVESATSRKAWVALGKLIGEFAQTLGAGALSDPVPGPRRSDLV